MKGHFIFKKVLALSLVVSVVYGSALSASAWTGTTHKTITDKAIEIIKNDQSTTEYEFFNRYKTILKDYCTKPDKTGDVDFTQWKGWHYYNVRNSSGEALTASSTGAYYKNASDEYSRSARTIFEEEYTMAVCQYRSGQIAQSLESLGRAIHLLSDIGCTPHTTNTRRNATTNHEAYEELAEDLCKESGYYATKSTLSLYYSYGRSSFDTAVNSLAKYSGSLTRLNYMKNMSDNKTNAKKAIKDTLCYTEQNVAAMLHNFYVDIKYYSKDKNYIVDGGVYYIKNRKSGKYMDVPNYDTSDGTDIIQYTGKKGKNQQFIAVLNDDGTFSFYPVCDTSTFLYVDWLNHVELQSGKITDEAKFRLAYTGDGWFRITTQNSGFESILRVESPYLENLSKIVEYTFNPNSLNHYWAFEEA